MQAHPASSDPTGKREFSSHCLQRIVSGGQTGADRTALDFAIEHGIPHGGWCPLGRLAEDGRIDERYALRETPSPVYEQRTEWNVRDSDATVILTLSAMLQGGSRATALYADSLGRPWVHLARDRAGTRASGLLHEFLVKHRVRVLNVAGSRASSEPGVASFVRKVLSEAL